MDQPEPIFLGFRVKKVMTRPDWLDDPRVLEVCSVSDCMSEPPPDWIQRWDFNAAGCYESIEAAVATIPDHESLSYTTFAYFLYLMEFDEDDRVESRSIADLLTEHGRAMLPSVTTCPFPMIGYDVVQVSAAEVGSPGRMFQFYCSPLSCNHRSVDYPVNKRRLLDTWSDAVRAARDFASGGAEPPPYYIVRVHRPPDAG